MLHFKSLFCSMQSQVLPVQGDLMKEDDVKTLLNSTVKHFGKLDILVNTLHCMIVLHLEIIMGSNSK